MTKRAVSKRVSHAARQSPVAVSLQQPLQLCARHRSPGLHTLQALWPPLHTCHAPSRMWCAPACYSSTRTIPRMGPGTPHGTRPDGYHAVLDRCAAYLHSDAIKGAPAVYAVERRGRALEGMVLDFGLQHSRVVSMAIP